MLTKYNIQNKCFLNILTHLSKGTRCFFKSRKSSMIDSKTKIITNIEAQVYIFIYILLILAASHKVTKTKFTSSYILLILATSHKVTKSQ